MVKTRQPLIILLPIATGLIATVALVVQHFLVQPLPGCGPASYCQQAMNSEWASVAGWPVSFLGLAGFCGLAAIWPLLWHGVPPSIVFLARGGALVSLFFLGVIFLHHHYCIYCLVTHAAVLAVWVLIELSDRRQGAGLRAVAAWLVAAMATSAVLNVLETERRWARSVQLEAEFQSALREAIDIGRAAGNDRQKDKKGEDSSLAVVTNPRKATSAPPGIALEDKPPPAFAELADRYRRGPQQAPLEILIFSDYQCPYCRDLEEELQQILRQPQYEQLVSVVIRHYPVCTECNFLAEVNQHPNACRAARAAEAGGILQGGHGFWRMHQWLFQRQGDFTDADLLAALGSLGFGDPVRFLEVMNSQQTLAAVLNDIVEAEARKIPGTPAIYLNGVYLRGWQADNALTRAVQAVLAARQRAPLPLDNRMEEAVRSATVRLVDRSSNSWGSGTLVDLQDGEAWILTADHLLQAEASVEVHLFSSETYPAATQVFRSVEVFGRLPQQDLALLRLKTREALPAPLRLCPPDQLPSDFPFQAFTGGCSGGDAPSCWPATVSRNVRIRRDARGEAVLVWEADPPPETGRSGGPLVDDRGRLLGICSGVSEGNGYYCHSDEILRFLQPFGVAN